MVVSPAPQCSGIILITEESIMKGGSMKQTDGRYLEIIARYCDPEESDLLEVGCGDGRKTGKLLDRFRTVTAIDTSEQLVLLNRQNPALARAAFYVASGSATRFDDQSFDVVLFSLSFHHLPVNEMSTAILEAIRLLRPNGIIIFLEPDFVGTFYEAERRFGICDGDEREVKIAAYFAILTSQLLVEVAEEHDETLFQFDGWPDFSSVFTPTDGTPQEIIDFLCYHSMALTAVRRITIARPICYLS